MIKFLIMFQDVFAYSYDDMSGILTDIVVYRLPINPNFSLIKQESDKFNADISLKIKEQIEKQLNARIIIVSHYPFRFQIPYPFRRKVEKCEYISITRISTKLVRKMIFRCQTFTFFWSTQRDMKLNLSVTVSLGITRS